MKIKVHSEEGAIEWLEQAYFGTDVSVNKVSLEHDDLAEVNSVYDCAQGSRHIIITMSDNEIFHIRTEKRIFEDEDDNTGAMIGSHTDTNTHIETDNLDIVASQKKFISNTRNFSYDISMSLDNQAQDREEKEPKE